MKLITPVEVIKKAHVDHNMDPQVFESHIKVAEIKLWDDCLGKTFFEELIADLREFAEFDSTATYALDDIVHFEGAYYKCKANGTTNILPTEVASWDASTKFTTAKYQILWDDYLWPVLALMVQHTSTFTNSIRTTAQGEMVNNTASSEGADYRVVKAKKEELSDNIRILTKAMDAFLIKEKEDYATYKGNVECSVKRNDRPSLGVFLND